MALNVLSAILSFKKNRFQFWLAISGIFIGLITTLLTIMLFIDTEFSKQSNSDLFGENSVIIQKRVTRFTSLGLNETGFSESEITALKNKPEIIDVAPFLSATYEVGISENPGDGLPNFYANMFLQSVPNHFFIRYR